MSRRPRPRRPAGRSAVVAAFAACVAATEGAKVAAGLTAAPTPAQSGLLVAVVAMSGLLAWMASPERGQTSVTDKKMPPMLNNPSAIVQQSRLRA